MKWNTQKENDGLVKQMAGGRDIGSTTVALVRAGNQKKHPVPHTVMSD